MIEIKIVIDNIDYSGIADVVMPTVIEKLNNDPNGGLAKGILAKTGKLSVPILKAALTVMPQEIKDSIAIELINKYQEKISETLVSELKKRDIGMNIASISVDEYDDSDVVAIE